MTAYQATSNQELVSTVSIDIRHRKNQVKVYIQIIHTIIEGDIGNIIA